MWRLAFLFVIFLVFRGVAVAQPLSGHALASSDSGVLLNNATVNTTSQALGMPRRAASLLFDVSITGSATVYIERANKRQGPWRMVRDSLVTASDHFSIHNPSGLYRAVVTNCSACTVTVEYYVGPYYR